AWACRWAARPGTPSTRPATWARAWCTHCSRSPTRARRTGVTRGSPSWGPSSGRPCPGSSSTRPSDPQHGPPHEQPSERAALCTSSLPNEQFSERTERIDEGDAMTDTFVAAIDQGTTSSRCIVFDQHGAIVAVDQREHRQIFPRPGWVEHDATEIWSKVQVVVAGALAKAGLRADELSALGITNQRETTVLWDRATGKPVHNAIVWQDTRTAALCRQLGGSDGQDRFREQTGLPLASYFSGPTAAWLLDNVPGLRARAENGDIAFGTIDSWLIWNLTGGPDGGRHVTDVTNAGRTMLMNLETLQWDPSILSAMNVPEAVLPEIRSSAEVYGTAVGPLAGVPVASALGDQQAAVFGQACFDVGTAKNTYGTGSFLLLNTGDRPVPSKSGLLTTMGYRIGEEAPVYCLEGSIAITGALV